LEIHELALSLTTKSNKAIDNVAKKIDNDGEFYCLKYIVWTVKPFPRLSK